MSPVRDRQKLLSLMEMNAPPITVAYVTHLIRTRWDSLAVRAHVHGLVRSPLNLLTDGSEAINNITTSRTHTETDVKKSLEVPGGEC